MTRKISILVSLLLSVVTWTVSGLSFALGVGEITLHSHLNQPLNAEIKLVNINSLTNQEILAGLASKEDFQAAKVERSFLVTQLRFNVITQSDGSGIIKVTSRKPIREPFLNFLVEVHWPAGRLLREYTLLLDPPLYGDAVPSAVNVSAPQSIESRTTQQAPEQSRQGTQNSQATALATLPSSPSSSSSQTAYAAADDASSEGYDEHYKVLKNDTLGKIAKRIKPRGADLNQAMIAIQRRNPKAFIDGNINLVLAGKVLSLPSEEEIAAVSRQEAIEEVNRQYRSWKASRSTRSNTASRLEGQQLKTSSDSITQESDPYEGDGRLKLISAVEGQSSGEGASTGTSGESGGNVGSLSSEILIKEEELDKSRLALEDLNQQVAEMAAQIETSEQILKLKNEQLAALEARLAEMEQQRAQQAEQLNQSEVITGRIDGSEEGSEELNIGQETEQETEQEGQGESQDYNYLEETEGEAAEGDAESSVEVDAESESESEAADLYEEEGGSEESEQPPAATQGSNDMTIYLILGGMLALMMGGGALYWWSKRRSEEDEYVATPEDLADALDDMEDQALEFDSDETVLSGDETLISELAGEDETLISEDETLISQDDTLINDDATLISEDETVLAFDEAEQTSIEGEDDFAETELALLDEDGEEDEVSDLLGEADIYIAYGRFDQAIEMLKAAVAKAPSRIDLQVKLLEVYAESQDSSGFKAAASQALALGNAQLNDKVRALSGQLGIEVEEVKEASTADEPAEELAGTASESNITMDDIDDELDFDLDLDEGVDVTQLVAEQYEEETPSLDELEESLKSDSLLGVDDVEAVDELEEIGELEEIDSVDAVGGVDSFDEPEQASAVEKEALEEEGETEGLTEADRASDELNLEPDSSEFETNELRGGEMDFGDDELNDALQDLEEGEETDDLTALSLELELPEEDDGSALALDAAELEAELGEALDSESNVDEEALDDPVDDAMNAAADDAVDDVENPRLDTAEAPEIDDSTAESIASELEADGLDLSLDLEEDGLDAVSSDILVEEADSHDDEFGTVTMDLDDGSSDVALDEFEQDGHDEAETKLDLARAYIDMGDREGAKDILDEVVSEGNDQQQEEAKALIQKCG